MWDLRLRIITLLSDFGLIDPYVAEMKAVILSIYPDARIVDISHGIEKFNVRMGAFILASAAPYFPIGTVNLAVVDPGVGTKRRPIIVETGRSLYVGPDNGLLILSALIDGITNIYHITSEKYVLPQVSRTFHGRDIFAPVAACLASGVKPNEFGPEIRDFEKPPFAEPDVKGGEVSGEILFIDSFGNMTTNISAGLLQRIKVADGVSLKIDVGEKSTVLKLCKAYGEAPPQTPLAIISSSNFLEISVNQGNAAETFRAKVGDTVKIAFPAVSH